MKILLTSRRLSTFLRLLRVLFLSAFLATLARPAFAASITIGSSNAPNVFPFGCGSTCSFPYLGEYQQIYASSAFSGPLTIDEVAFETSPVSASHPISSSFTLSLGTTATSPSAPGSSYNATKGADFTQVFAGIISIVTMPGTFDFVITLSTPFTYNPASGNLLLDAFIISDSNPPTPFAAGSDTNVGRIFNVGGTGAPTGQGGLGLLTRFTDIEPASSVPEPASLLFLGTGLIGAGSRHWRNRRRAA